LSKISLFFKTLAITPLTPITLLTPITPLTPITLLTLITPLTPITPITPLEFSTEHIFVRRLGKILKKERRLLISQNFNFNFDQVKSSKDIH
jgi:hypothetical protein